MARVEEGMGPVAEFLAFSQVVEQGTFVWKHERPALFEVECRVKEWVGRRERSSALPKEMKKSSAA